jgi:hypothetical protein
LVAKGEKGPWELYDMRIDRSEQNDLASRDSSRVENMDSIWQTQDDLYKTQRESARPSKKPLLAHQG